MREDTTLSGNKIKPMKRYFNKKFWAFWIALTASFTCGFFIHSTFFSAENFHACAHRQPSGPFFAVKEHKPLVIIVPSYNNAEWVEKNLSSIFTQKYDNYRVIYIDDASTDGTLQKVGECIAIYQAGHRIEVIHNTANQGACANTCQALQSCSEEEIAVILDGDDWFAHDRVLQRLNEVYADPTVWLTYGSYIEYPTYGYTVANFSQALPKEVIQRNAVRAYSRKHWCLSHLRTFYVHLFKKLNAQDLQWNGAYFDASSDVALMVPMVEMAGAHAKYLDEVLYIYNRASPLNDNKIKAKRQQQVAQHIFELPRYAQLSSLSSQAHYAKDLHE